MKNETTGNTALLSLSGRIDSNNAAETEKKLFDALPESGVSSVVLDAGTLEYISSAGLRVILRLKKIYPELRVINVNSEVYEILEMTGFTEMMTVEKAYRVVSVEGCEVIGEGFNGSVYRIDQDNVVKVYKNADALADIQHEREVARLALILGVPTAISYDVVRVGDSYGSVFELLNAQSFAKILAEQPERMDWCVDEYVKMLRTIHSIEVPEGKLPSIKAHTMKKVERLRSVLPADAAEKIYRLVDDIPESSRMVHGDYHTKNIVLVGDEVLLIDMDTLSVGHPIFELAQMYNSFVGFSEYNHKIVLDFQGFDFRISQLFWQKSLQAYLGTNDPETVRRVEEKVRCVAYAELIDWRQRHPSGDEEENAATLAFWKKELLALLQRVDSLEFDVSAPAAAADELVVEAQTENLRQVTEFVDRHLSAVDCPPKAQMQIGVAVEEIFVNIASYAYAPDKGNATVRVEVSGEPIVVTITFIDNGVPYDPLSRTDPNTSLPAEDREIGGLGIFMTKKLMDGIEYEYSNGQNILKLKKNL